MTELLGEELWSTVLSQLKNDDDDDEFLHTMQLAMQYPATVAGNSAVKPIYSSTFYILAPAVFCSLICKVPVLVLQPLSVSRI